MPELKMQMGSGREVSCIADNGYGCSCLHLVSYLFEQLVVMLVDRYDVVSMLDLNCVSVVFAPACEDYGAVKSCLYS